jgi:hypothetical protein
MMLSVVMLSINMLNVNLPNFVIKSRIEPCPRYRGIFENDNFVVLAECNSLSVIIVRSVMMSVIMHGFIN